MSLGAMKATSERKQFQYVMFQYVPYSVKLNGSSILYSCCQKFTDTHEYCGNFWAFNDFFKLFFLQGLMIVQHTSLLTLKNKNK